MPRPLYASRPATRSVAVLFTLTVIWIAYSVIDTLVISSSTLTRDFYIGLGLWCLSVAVLWIGVVWGFLAGVLALVVTLSLGYISIEQVLFLLTVTGFAAAYTSPLFRRASLVFVLGIGVYIASLMEDLATQSVVYTVYFFATVISYLFGRAVRLQRDKTTKAEQGLRELTLIQKEDRRALAGELHDSVANDVTTIAMYAKEASIRQDHEFTLRALKMVQQRAESATDHLRHMVDILREDDKVVIDPSDNSQPNITEALKVHEQELEAIGIPTTIGFSGDPRTLSAPVHRTVCITVQEAVTNVMKYGARNSTSAHAWCHINVSIESEAVDVSVSSAAENGNHRKQHKGLGSGLEILRNRVESFGGTLSYGAQDNNAWVLRAESITKN